MKKLNSEQGATVHCGVRWCINILAELGNNYGRLLSTYRREKLQLAIASLHCVIGHNPDEKG